MDECFFKPCGTEKADKPLTTAGPARIRTIISFSKLRQNVLHDNLEKQLAINENLTITCHRDCVSSYTSRSHIKRHVQSLQTDTDLAAEDSSNKRYRRSELPTFDFKQYCFFCGELCLMNKDRENPGRWRHVSLCRTADRGEHKTFKQTIVDNCDSRQGGLGRQVRLMGAVSDLHAADARYHRDCYTLFMALRSISAANRSDQQCQNLKTAIDSTVSSIRTDLSRIWNSIEVYNMYIEHGGKLLSRRALVAKLSDIFGPDLLVLSGVGLASVLVFRSTSLELIHLAASDEDDDTEAMLERIATKITKESLKLKSIDRNCYQTRINIDTAIAEVSSTLQSLLSKVSHKLDNTLPATLIGNMITNIITNKPTALQIALGVLLSRKTVIEQMYNFRVTCSYDEVQRFKASVANATTVDTASAKNGLVQAVADNFDANISSQNGLHIRLPYWLPFRMTT